MAKDPIALTQVRLTRKFAEVIDGVDLSQNQVGDRLELSDRDAQVLIAEGWAAPEAPSPVAPAKDGEK